MNTGTEFIIGEPGSGKTFLMTEKIKASLSKGEKVLVIVPEQFSSAAERKLYNALGIALFNRIQVDTFTRVRRNILKKNRISAGNIPGEAAGIAVMYTVRRELARSTLMTFTEQIKNPAFTLTCLDIVRELEMNGIASKVLVSDKLGDTALEKKTADINAICEAYTLRLAECGYRTSLSDGEEVAQAAAASGFFKGMKVFIDGFKSFTADQLRLIEIMKGQCYVSVCMPTPYPKLNSSPVFSAVNETMNDIDDSGDAVITLVKGETDRFSDAPDIRMLSRSVLRGESPAPFSSEHIHIAEAPDVCLEADYVCADISRGVRSGKYSYGDIAIVSRDFEDLAGVLEDSFIKYEIPYFIDCPSAALAKPLCLFIAAVLEAAASPKLSAEMVLRIMKTGFAAPESDHISELENYYTEHGILSESFDTSPVFPEGTDISYETLKKYDNSELPEDEHEELSEALENGKNAPFIRAEIIRKTVITPLKKFKEECGSTLNSITAALCDTLNAIAGEREFFGGITEESAEGREASRVKKAVETTLGNISQVTLPESCDEFTLREYCDIFQMAASKIKLSSPAHSSNCVTAASADRARLDDPKSVYIMGAASGIFPYAVSESGIFSERELEILENVLGIRFNERIFRMAAEENFIAVSCLAAPSKELSITCSLSGSDGKARRRSSLMDTAAALAGIKIENLAEKPSEFFVTTPASAYGEYVRYLSGRSELSAEKAASVLAAFEDRIKDKCLKTESFKNDIADKGLVHRKISPENALKLYCGKKGGMNISASRLEDEAKCPFMFFCRKGLKLENVKKHEYNAIVRGNTAHYAMRKILSELLKKAGKENVSFNREIALCSEEYFRREAKTAMEEYLKLSYPEDKYSTPELFLRSFKSREKDIVEILMHIQREFSPEVSRFSPCEFEFSIGRLSPDGNEDMPPVIFYVKTEEGREVPVYFTGSVDRVDIFTDNSSGEEKKYIRAADYKTGKKDFELADLANGMNMQTLLYLYALTSSGKYKECSPGGIMYVPMHSAEFQRIKDRSVLSGDKDELLLNNIDEKLRSDCLALNDVNVIRAMEYSADGKFIPARLNGEAAKSIVESCGKALRQAAGIGEALTDSLTAELCLADDIHRLAENAGIEESAAKEYSKALNYDSCKALREEFLSAYRVYTEFDKYLPDTEKMRKRLSEAFTENSGKLKFPSPETALTEEEFENVMSFVTAKTGELCADILNGKADPMPLSGTNACEYCEYKSVCDNCIPIHGSIRYPKSGKEAAAEYIKGDSKNEQ